MKWVIGSVVLAGLAVWWFYFRTPAAAPSSPTSGLLATTQGTVAPMTPVPTTAGYRAPILGHAPKPVFVKNR